MELFLLLSFFAFGLIIGSFINALSFRYNSGKGMMSRSMCFSCSHTLGILDLIPLFSYLGLRGHCRYCFSKISWQYPLVEFLTGLAFMIVIWKYMPYIFLPNIVAEVILSCIFWSAFIFIAVYDQKHKIVPNEAVYGMMILGLLNIVFFREGRALLHIYQALALFLPFFLIWLVSRGRWMGLGDGKLILAIGLFMPIAESSSGVILAFWIGTLYAFAAIITAKFRLNLMGKKLTMKSELAFVPFLFLGVLASYAFALDLLNLSLLSNVSL